MESPDAEEDQGLADWYLHAWDLVSIKSDYSPVIAADYLRNGVCATSIIRVHVISTTKGGFYIAKYQARQLFMRQHQTKTSTNR